MSASAPPSPSNKAVSAAVDFFRQTGAFWARPATIIRNYNVKENLRADILAGATVGVLMLPQAIAYALIAELPPITGLYAAIVASIVGALWGSSSHLNSGPSNAASLLVLTTLLPLAVPGTPEYLLLAGMMAFIVGLMRLLMGLLRLGYLVNFVADSVIIGFTFGAAILIGVNQVKHLLRVSVTNTPNFFATVSDTFLAAPQTHLPSFIVGVGAIVLSVVFKKTIKRIPSALLVMALAGFAAYWFDLPNKGVIVLGDLPAALPSFVALPVFSREVWGQLFTGSLAVAAIGLAEAVAIARSISAQSGEKIDSNQEFVGQGLASMATGFLSGYACSGSFTRSALNYSSGAKTGLTNIFSALFVLAAMMLFARLTSYLPRAALAGVIIVTAYYMIDREAMGEIWRTTAGDAWIMISTFLATLVFPLQFAVLAGIVVSFVRYIGKTSQPEVSAVTPSRDFGNLRENPGKPQCPQLGIVTIKGSLYFGSTQHVEEAIRLQRENHPEQKNLLLWMQQVNLVDISGLHLLEAIVRLYRSDGGDVYMEGVRNAVKDKMYASGFVELLGENHFLDRETAIPFLFNHAMNPLKCVYECPHKVWLECQSLPKAKTDLTLPPIKLVTPEMILAEYQPEELMCQMQLDQNLKVIDVRDESEFNWAHIPNSQLISLPELLTDTSVVPKDGEVVLVCRFGRRSRQIQLHLQDKGYENVSSLRGGLNAWQEANLPVDMAPAVIPT